MNNAIGSVSTIRNFIGNAGRNVCNEYLYEALKDADEALQKQIPVKTKVKTTNEDVKVGRIIFSKGTTVHYCPQCGIAVTGSERFCRNCGQALIY